MGAQAGTPLGPHTPETITPQQLLVRRGRTYVLSSPPPAQSEPERLSDGSVASANLWAGSPPRHGGPRAQDKQGPKRERAHNVSRARGALLHHPGRRRFTTRARLGALISPMMTPVVATTAASASALIARMDTSTVAPSAPRRAARRRVVHRRPARGTAAPRRARVRAKASWPGRLDRQGRLLPCRRRNLRPTRALGFRTRPRPWMLRPV